MVAGKMTFHLPKIHFLREQALRIGHATMQKDADAQLEVTDQAFMQGTDFFHARIRKTALRPDFLFLNILQCTLNDEIRRISK